jgi:hypothetical protein
MATGGAIRICRLADIRVERTRPANDIIVRQFDRPVERKNGKQRIDNGALHA